MHYVLHHWALNVSEHRLDQNLSKMTDHNFLAYSQLSIGKKSSGVELVTAVLRCTNMLKSA